MMMHLAMQSGPPTEGPLNEESDLQQALSLCSLATWRLSTIRLQENMEPAKPDKVNEALQLSV